MRGRTENRRTSWKSIQGSTGPMDILSTTARKCTHSETVTEESFGFEDPGSGLARGVNHNENIRITCKIIR